MAYLIMKPANYVNADQFYLFDFRDADLFEFDFRLYLLPGCDPDLFLVPFIALLWVHSLRFKDFPPLVYPTPHSYA